MVARSPEDSSRADSAADARDVDPGRARRAARLLDAAAALSVVLAIFLLGARGYEAQVVLDGRYTLLIAESILVHGDGLMSRHVPPLEESYHLARAPSGELVSLYPLGGPIFFLPFAAATRALGYPVLGDDGSIRLDRNARIQPLMATLLMAVAGGMLFLVARRRGIGRACAAAVAVTAILGTMMFSIGARALWPDTSGVFLLTAALALILGWGSRGEVGGAAPGAAAPGASARWSLVAMAAGAGALGFLPFIKPTYAITAAAIGAIVVWESFSGRGRPLGLVVFVAAAAAVVVAMRATVRALLPIEFDPYSAAIHSLSLRSMGEALAGTLVSPSRGLVWYCPFVVPLALWLLVRGWRHPRWPRLVGLAGAIAGQIGLVAIWPMWWGGSGYGPRLLLGAMPLWAFLAIELLAPAARVESPPASPSPDAAPPPLAAPPPRTAPIARRVFAAVLISTSLLSVAIHVRGGLTLRVWQWNDWLGTDTSRLWEWRYPQMLTGWIVPPLPETMPPLASRDVVIDDSAHPYTFFHGWNMWEESFRWTNGRRAVLLFGRLPDDVSSVSIRADPFVDGRRVRSQRVVVRWDGQEIGRGSYSGTMDETFLLPDGDRRGEFHRLELYLPDAISPAALRLSGDERELAFALKELSFH